MFTLPIFCGIFHSSPPPQKIFTPLLLPLMAFHHRKLLHKNHHQFHVSPAPSPVQSPLSLPKPLPFESTDLPLTSMEDHHIHVLRIALIITSCMVGVFMFLCTFSVLRRVYYNSRRQNNNQNQNRTTSPILFDFNDDSPGAEDEEPVIDHPIWFIRTVGLQQSLIDSITVFKYRKDEALIDGTECSVCLGEFKDDESLRLLPKCSHGFHIPCIDTWLRSHKNCPLCRAPVFHETEERVTEQSQSQSQEAETDNSDGGEGEGSSNRVGEIESSELRIEIEEDGDSGGIQDKMLGNSGEEETEEPIRRSVSMDSCSASVVFRDVDLDRESSESDTHFGEKMNSSICSKELGIVKSGGSGSFSSICKLGLIGRALQKRPVLMRRSFSHNRKFLSSRHCRSHSSTLPL